MNKDTKDLLARIEAVRRFPQHTTPASRHTEMIAEHLAASKQYAMLTEEPEHCAGSLLATVLSLYEAKIEIEHLRAQLAKYDRPLPEWMRPGNQQKARGND